MSLLQGYVLVWGVFSLFATLTQWRLERAGLLDAAMASTSNILGAVVFVAAGPINGPGSSTSALLNARCRLHF